MESGTAPRNKVTATPQCLDQAPRLYGFRQEWLGPVLCLVSLAILIGVFKLVGISLRIDALTLFGLYFSIGVQSATYAVILIGVQFPKELFLPGFLRVLKRPEFIVVGLALGFLFFRLLPAGFAFSLLVAILALTQVPWSKMKAALVPGVYLFVGLFTAFGYNVVAVTVRFKPDYDSVLRRADAFFLFGHSVSEVSHRFAAAVPGFVTNDLLIWYALMFVQVGAALMLCSTLVSREYAMRFVSTILLAYAITVSIFFVFPTHSPYFTCKDHATAALPREMLEIQRNFVDQATERWSGSGAPLGPEYYVSFPCMHIAQPLIAMYFLKRWRRILQLLVVVNTVLAFAIVILEWHYFVDLIGGAAVAIVCIWLVNKWSHQGSRLAVV